ncbi:tyrosinase family protein [Streptomyces lavendulocolor]|uniref:tyrosinase family protein n=1 Tax=Streptomyces lavendulocolor TaxID=67316 RepID=UPI003C2D8F92
MAAAVRMRRDTTRMTEIWDDQLLWYARAVRAMQGKPETDPTSWLFQANIHGTSDGREDPEWNNCPHGGWFFLPWHRAYILCFEEIVRRVVEEELGGPDDWALPYWNYTRVTNGDPNSPESQACRRLPSPFLSPDWPDGTGDNPLFLAPGPQGRDPDAAEGSSIEWPEVNPHQAMQAPDFTGAMQFGSADTDSQAVHFNPGGSGLLEMQPHNLIHGFVGGVMSQFFSPQDPVFWLHHSNIDRLWAAWLTNSAHRNPTDADWLGFTHHFRNAQGARVGFTTQDLLSEQQLGYGYESLTDGVGLKPPERLVAMLPAGANPPSEQVVAATGTTDLGAEALTVPLTPEPGARPSALPEAASPETPSRAILTIDGVRADAPPGTNYRVFVGARPDSAEDLDPEGPYFIGHLHFFGAVGDSAHHHHHAHAGAGLTFRFDITDHLTELRRLGTWDGEGIPPVVVTPAPLGPPPAAAGTETREGLRAREAHRMPTVPPGSHPRIGSVSLITT